MEATRPTPKPTVRNDFLYHWYWMGPGALPLVLFQSIFISLALTTQSVLELSRYNAEDLSGSIISIGLLRDLGPLTVGLSWAARLAAFISQEREEWHVMRFVEFIAPRYFAALLSAMPLTAFGLVAAFLAASVYAPVLGVSSGADFMEAARETIKNKDLVTFCFKMVVINPALGVFMGALCAGLRDRNPQHAAAHAIAFTCVLGAFLNWIVTTSFYLQ